MTVELPFVSIIVLNYNGRSFLDKCLSSLSQINYPKSCYEVILVDNGSVDDSGEYVEENFPWVRVLALDRNYGYTGGNNRGVRIAKGDFIVFLNNDTLVDKEWLRELVNVMLLDKKIAICGSKVVFMDNPNHIQYAGGFLNLLGGTLFYPFHGPEPKRDFYFVGSICGASFIIRKTIFETLNGFDEDFFMYSDENDLSLRVWIYGYYVTYAPASVVYHFAVGSSSGFGNNFHFRNLFGARLISPLTIYHGNKNSIASVIKNFNLRNILLGGAFLVVYFVFQLLLILRKGDNKGAWLLMKAYFWPLKNLKSLWKKRLIIQARRKVSDDWLVKNELLITGKTLKLLIYLRHRSKLL